MSPDVVALVGRARRDLVSPLKEASRSELMAAAHEVAATDYNVYQAVLDGLEALQRAPDPSGVYLVRASEIKAESVEWFEDGLIPLRVVTLITGLDGVGKSTILYTKGALATRGKLPGHFKGAPVDVVIASSEDHAQTVIKPRLAAAGADLDRVHIVKVLRDGLDGEISLPDDLPEVAGQVEKVGARLLIVDPLISFMPLHIDGHKAQHVRSVLAPLARLAEDARLAVGAVVHFNGSPSTDVRTRISGSKALRDAARSVLVCGPDPADESRFLIVQDKNSFGPKPSTGRAYRIEGTNVDLDGAEHKTSRVVWLGEVPITTRNLLAGPGTEDRTERDIARDVILDALSERDHRWADLVELVKDEGAAEITARRARDSLKSEGLIKSVKTVHGWWWTRETNLLTPLGQVDGEQVEKGTLTREKTPEPVQLAHTLDGEQVEMPDPFEGL